MAWLRRQALLKEDGDRLLLESGAIMVREDLASDSGRALPEAARLLTESGNLMQKEAADGYLLVEGMTAAASETGNVAPGAKLPAGISRGATSGPTFRTTYQQTRDGHVVRIPHWSKAPIIANVALSQLSATDAAQLLNFYRAVRGPLDAFRFEDPLDWSTHPNHRGIPSGATKSHRQVLGAYDPAEAQFYQLVKSYRIGNLQVNRVITRPMLPGDPNQALDIYVDGTLLTEGTDYTVDYNGGGVTIGAGLSFLAGAEVEWSGTFDVLANFTVEIDESLRSELWRETVLSVGSLPIAEAHEIAWFSDHPYPGGAHSHTMTSSTRTYQIDLHRGRFQSVTPDVNGRVAYLPTADELGAGTPMLYLKNGASGGSGRNLVVKQQTGTDVSTVSNVVTSLPPQEIAELWIARDTPTATPTWRALR